MHICSGTEEVIEFESYLCLCGQNLIDVEDFAQSGEGCSFYLGRQEQGSEGKHLQFPQVHLIRNSQEAIEVMCGVGKDLPVVVLTDGFRQKPLQQFLYK